MGAREIKVLFVAHYSGMYGANRSLLQLITELRSFYYVHAFVVVPKEGAFTRQLKEQGVPYRAFNYYNWADRTTSAFKNTAKKFLNVYYFMRVRQHLKRMGLTFDLVHSNSSTINLGAWLSVKMCIPHVWHIREFVKDDYRMNFHIGLSNAVKYMEKNSDCIIAVSSAIKSYYSEYIHADKIKVVYNGIRQPEAFKKVRNTERPVEICCLGGISEGKNQIEVIRAVGYLKNVLGISGFVLNIAGTGHEEYIDSLKAVIEKENLGDNVKFNGFISNLSAFLKSMDLGIVASTKEAFGRVTVEFMMHRIPVIVSNSGANQEIVTSPELGYIYSLGSYKELAEAILDFMENQDVWIARQDQLYAYATDNFSSGINTKHIYGIYEEVLHRAI